MKVCKKCGSHDFRSGRCYACKKEYQEKFFSENKDKLLVYLKNYRNEKKTEIREYLLKTKEKRNERDREYYYKKGGYIGKKCDKVKAKKYSKIWKARNKGKVAFWEAKRRASLMNATPIWANEFFIKEAYSLAKLRERIFGIKFHVDHIIPLNNEVVCGLHVENNLQVITCYENLKKYNKFLNSSADCAGNRLASS